MKFPLLCDLLERLEQYELTEVPLPPRRKDELYGDTIQAWFNNHRRLVDDNAALLSCLLPERRVDRTYSMGRPRLVNAVAYCLGLGHDNTKRLREVPPEADLAKIIAEIVYERGGGHGFKAVTVSEIDKCLANLAAISRWSSPAVRGAIEPSAPRYQREILQRVITRLSSREMKWFVRIFQKRLDPVQLKYNSILAHVHPLLPSMLKVRESFDHALELLRNPYFRLYLDEQSSQVRNLPQHVLEECFRPQAGSKVGRPLFLKARSFKHCAKLVENRRWSVEPKYDGEYCQLHIDLCKGNNCIQIFSKSGRDSTNDRAAVHEWVKHALRIDSDCQFKRQCILEGEIVVVDDRDNTVLEFDKIRKHVSRSGSFLRTHQDSVPHTHESLRIIFYDMLLIDEDVLIHQSYAIRREKLKKLLSNSPARSFYGQWGQVDFGRYRTPKVEGYLMKLFQKAQAARHEGLVLKPLDGAYVSMLPHLNGDYDGTIIKLKADYIPGLGDSADFAIVGAYTTSNHKVEAELLRETKWTHFVLACLNNKSEVCLHQSRPIFKLMGVVSRPAISTENMKYLSQHGRYRKENDTNYDIEVVGGGKRPKVLFIKPFIVDVVGSKFERPANTIHWMLRHPRVTKIHLDRSEQDVISFEELQGLAKEAREIPEDMASEELKIMERIRIASKPKRRTYVESKSPDSCTTMSASVASMRGLRTPERVFVRMGSCEMEAGDERFVSPLSKISNNFERQNEQSRASLKDNTRVQKRKSEASSGVSPPKRRPITRSLGNGCRQPNEAANNQPLQDKSNVSSAEHTIHSHFNTARILPNDNFLQTFKSRSRVPNNTFTSISSTSHHDSNMNINFASRPFPKNLSRESPLRETVVMLSPDIPGNGLVEKDLLHLFVNRANVKRDPEHWNRYRLPFVDPLGAKLDDTQADEGLSKVAVIEYRLGESSETFIKDLMRLRLGLGETIEVWDWRALEKLAEFDELASNLEPAELRKKMYQLATYFVGVIRLANQEEHEAIDRRGLVGAKAVVHSLSKAKHMMLTNTERPDEQLINLFEQPCDGESRRSVWEWMKAKVAPAHGLD